MVKVTLAQPRSFLSVPALLQRAVLIPAHCDPALGIQSLFCGVRSDVELGGGVSPAAVRVTQARWALGLAGQHPPGPGNTLVIMCSQYVPLKP